MSLIEILMQNFSYSMQDATEEIKDMKKRIFRNGEDAIEVLLEYGLESDYVFDLIN